ncbi:MAG: cysteine desulfurase family protein [Oligoflexia bacterium]|nr:cysteine desulfurase family protein [Oligoflexia bacterium]
MSRPIYLDYQATTPLDPEVFEIMKPYFLSEFGNPSSKSHVYGWNAEKAVEKARTQVAKLINSDSREIIFTSGATESNNLAIIGYALANKALGNHIVTTSVEHKAVLDSCKFLETQGFMITVLPVDSYGKLNIQDLTEAITDKTILVSVIFANNEIGTINDLYEIADFVKSKNIIFHTDATQALGKLSFNVKDLKADLISFSAHKIYGPKGIGALYVRKQNPRIKLAPLIHGGGHEQGLRSGTLNVPGIVGFGAACESAEKNQTTELLRIENLRVKLKSHLELKLDGLIFNGHPTDRLPHNLSVSFLNVPSEILIRNLTQVAISPGSACATASVTPSHVLKAIGLSDDAAMSTIRLSLGRFTTENEVLKAAQHIVNTVKVLGDSSPLYVSLKKYDNRGSYETQV